MMSQNLRREVRVDVRLPVVVYRGKAHFEVESSDVSYKGMFVKTTAPPPLRSLVRLRVTLLERSFDTHAMVVHVVSGDEPNAEGHEPGVGLLFWGLSGAERMAWDDFVFRIVQARRAAERAKQKAEENPPSSSSPSSASQPPTASGIRVVQRIVAK